MRYNNAHKIICNDINYVVYGDIKMSNEQAPNLIRCALFQPDMAGNVGAIIRLCASLGAPLDIIEPCGFVWDKAKIGRAAMDYMDLCDITRHKDWGDFKQNQSGRIILMTTKGATNLYDFKFEHGDILLAGQESAGAPDYVHEASDARIKIPMYGQARSLNIGHSCAIVMSEAIRQLR